MAETAYPVEEYFQRIRVDAPHISPDGKRLAWLSFVSGTPQWWISSFPEPKRLLEYPRPLTNDADRRPNPLTAQIAWFPDSKRVVYTHDFQGDEEYRLRVVDLESGLETEIPHPDKARDHLSFVSKDGRYVYFSSNRVRAAVQSLMRWDAKKGHVEELHTPSDDLSVSWAHDKRWRSYDLYTIDISNLINRLAGLDAAKKKTLVLSPPGDYAITPVEVLDDKSILVLTNFNREFMSLAIFYPEIQRFEYLFKETWDQRAWLSPRKDRLFIIENRAGRDVLTVRKWRSLRALKARTPTNGIFGDLDFDKSGRIVVAAWQSPVSPAEIVALEETKNKGYGWRRLTDNYISRVPQKTLVQPKLVSYRSADKKKIYAWLFLPRGAKKNGTLPVVVWPHGGPQWQERAQQRPNFQYYLSKGIAIFAHNPRGSTGFGRSFSEAIERSWGIADFPDLEAGVEWLEASGWVDRKRIGIMGGSYGGYMTLRAITKRPDIFKVAVDIFGPSNLFTFVNSVPDDWKPYMDRLVGHPERDKEILKEGSPFFAVDDIVCPLMVVQGARDPRAVKAESDQIVDKLEKRGHPVEYLVFEDEGHGFFKRENEMKFVRIVADFLEARL
jgi:dipeptidyl aminopeptidase/acylaminoacyl peptidase